jgi:UDP-3-O-[3-hydroxymyristoyl] glucosamine N-acyltransferase
LKIQRKASAASWLFPLQELFFMPPLSPPPHQPICTLSEILAALGGQFVMGGGAQAPEQIALTQIAGLETAPAGSISFITRAQFLQHLPSCQASCLIVSEKLAPSPALQRFARIVVPDAYYYYALLTQWWKARSTPSAPAGVHPSSVIDPSAHIHPSARIGPLCVVEAGAKIGAGTHLANRVTVGTHCEIGQDCLLHSGVVIGADGFGFAQHQGAWQKIEQLGRVVIGNQVEIGANTCIDRGALGDTVIADGVKLDNLVQIGHNVHIGAHSAMAGCVGVAGSAHIGAHCTVGGGAVVLGHLALADGVHISASSTVTRSIRQPGLYSGVFPLDENASWEKNAVTLKQLHALRERVRTLEKQLKSP